MDSTGVLHQSFSYRYSNPIEISKREKRILNMAFRKLTTIVAAMATISMCAAVPGSDVPAIERSADDLVIVTMYSDINWSGSSQKFTIQTQNTCCKCLRFPAGPILPSYS